jgi:5'-3' exoribonuclease 2
MSQRHTCVLSDTLEVGEGEHKIFDIIHKDNAGHVDVVYGLDADLIMLAMINLGQGNGHSISLLREPVFYESVNKAPFLYMDVSMLATLIRTHLSSQYGLEGVSGSCDIVHIYVFLCFFLGNDFVPNASYIKLKEDGLELLMTEYARTTKELGGEHILFLEQGRYRLNPRVLWKLLEKLASQEDACFAQIHEAYRQQTFRPYRLDGANTNPKARRKQELEQQIQAWPLFNKGDDVIQPHNKGWRLNYYHALFDSSGDIVNDVCSNYIQGLYWLIDCYFHHSPHRGWYYKHAYSPTLLDLFNYVTINVSKLDMHSSLDASYADVINDPDLQLLCILPPSSAHLVKPQLRHIMSDVRLGCVHMFPYSFGLEGYLRKFLWECHPLLPVPNVATLQKGMLRTTTYRDSTTAISA